MVAHGRFGFSANPFLQTKFWSTHKAFSILASDETKAKTGLFARGGEASGVSATWFGGARNAAMGEDGQFDDETHNEKSIGPEEHDSKAGGVAIEGVCWPTMKCNERTGDDAGDLDSDTVIARI